MTDDRSVLYDVADGIALVTLNRPAARNAVDPAVAARLGALAQEIEARDDIAVAILASSHPTVFCAGADLAEIGRGNADALSTVEGGFAGITRLPRVKPWIAAVAGAALAGGCEIALACDMIVATAAARFGLPEVKRGLFAAAAGPLRLQRALPRNIALELVATGDPIDAARAYQLGLVNRLTEDADAVPAARALAQAIAANAPLAVRRSLAITRAAADIDEAGYWRRSDEVTREIYASADAQEGPRAFLEKRPPAWQGR